MSELHNQSTPNPTTTLPRQITLKDHLDNLDTEKRATFIPDLKAHIRKVNEEKKKFKKLYNGGPNIPPIGSGRSGTPFIVKSNIALNNQESEPGKINKDAKKHSLLMLDPRDIINLNTKLLRELTENDGARAVEPRTNTQSSFERELGEQKQTDESENQVDFGKKREGFPSINLHEFSETQDKSPKRVNLSSVSFLTKFNNNSAYGSPKAQLSSIVELLPFEDSKIINEGYSKNDKFQLNQNFLEHLEEFARISDPSKFFEGKNYNFRTFSDLIVLAQQAKKHLTHILSTLNKYFETASTFLTYFSNNRQNGFFTDEFISENSLSKILKNTKKEKDELQFFEKQFLPKLDNRNHSAIVNRYICTERTSINSQSCIKHQLYGQHLSKSSLNPMVTPLESSAVSNELDQRSLDQGSLVDKNVFQQCLVSPRVGNKIVLEPTYTPQRNDMKCGILVKSPSWNFQAKDVKVLKKVNRRKHNVKNIADLDHSNILKCASIPNLNYFVKQDKYNRPSGIRQAEAIQTKGFTSMNRGSLRANDSTYIKKMQKQ